MRKSRTLNLGTGSFVLLGFAALFFLTTQTTSRGLSWFGPPHYELTAKFDNIGDLKVGAPVSMCDCNSWSQALGLSAPPNENLK